MLAEQLGHVSRVSTQRWRCSSCFAQIDDIWKELKFFLLEKSIWWRIILKIVISIFALFLFLEQLRYISILFDFMLFIWMILSLKYVQCELTCTNDALGILEGCKTTLTYFWKVHNTYLCATSSTGDQDSRVTQVQCWHTIMAIRNARSQIYFKF